MSPTFLHVVILLAAFGRGSSTEGLTTQDTNISGSTSNSSFTTSSMTSSITIAADTTTTHDATSESTTVESSTATTSQLSSGSSTGRTDSSSAPHTTQSPTEASLPTGSPADNTATSNHATTSSTMSTSNGTTTIEANTPTTIDTGTSSTPGVTDVTPTEPSTGNTSASLTTSVGTGPTATVTSLGPNATTSAPPTLTPAAVCPFIPCPLQSVCLNGTCQCLSGSFLLNGRCVPAQVFPGQLHLTSLTFEAGMSNRSSEIFQRTAAKISGALKSALGGQQGYIQSEVVRLQPGSVEATVNNIFENSNATQESVGQSIKDAIAKSQSADGLLSNATFAGTDLCAQQPLPCEPATTTCQYTNGRAVCFCRDGYVSVVYSNTSCRACPSGQRAVGDSCQPCAFGYAGFNCNDSSLLAVVVISCVLGGVLLLIILALFIFCGCQRCSERKPGYSSSPYSSGELNQAWPTRITPIPRASTTTFDAAPALEMTEGGSTGALVDKKHQNNGLGFKLKQTGWKKSGSYDVNPETMTTFTGKTPSRYSYLVQGHVNPYFLPGDEKKN
ncbi:protein HEG isoform X6 [Betta splendens]|uniref:Protein HEG isoform X6 n=1 Tax=Betta splendens TaxID=158456 RepID=A0A6P7NBH7_BETSP|nr:protein HEG isoform X6 [Betta splendens]